MISREEVRTLAALARLELPDIEIDKLRRDLESILEYVTGLKVGAGDLSATTHARSLSDNTLRLDATPHGVGIYTERLLAASPESRDSYVVVKPIFTDNGN